MLQTIKINEGLPLFCMAFAHGNWLNHLLAKLLNSVSSGIQNGGRNLDFLHMCIFLFFSHCGLEPRN